MKNQKWWILAAMTSCISMIFIDITVLPVALPTIQRLLDISDIGLQWIVNAYTLALTVFVLAGGRLGDGLGHRRIFCIGLLLFAFASALCGFSTGENWFVFSRALQGIGGALLIPSTSAIIFNSFPQNQRGWAMGIYVSVGSLFLAIGPFIGGLFTQYLTWRFIFWMNLPIALIGYTLTMLSVPPSPRKVLHLDWLGFLTFSLGLTLIVTPLMQIQSWGWTSALTLSLFTTGVLLLVLLCVIDRNVKDPYIDFSLFRERIFTGSLLASFFTQFVVMVTVYWIIFFQNVLAFSPAETGMLSLISSSPLILSAPLGGLLIDKFGPRFPLILGFSLVIGSLIWFLQIFDQKNFYLLLSAFIPFSCGMPLIFTPSISAAMTHVPKHKRGLASGTLMTIRQMGSTLGLAIFTSLFLSKVQTSFSYALSKNVQTMSLDPKIFSGLLSKVPHAMQSFEKLSPDVQEFVKKNDLHAHVEAFADINMLAIAMMVLGLLSVMWLVRSEHVSRDG